MSFFSVLPFSGEKSGGKKRCLSSYLCHLRPGDPHRHPHVRLFERWRVIGPVAGHGDDVPHLLQSPDEDELVGRRRAREDLKLRQELNELLLGFRAEVGSLHGEAALGEDATLAGDVLGGVDVVSRDHSDLRDFFFFLKKEGKKTTSFWRRRKTELLRGRKYKKKIGNGKKNSKLKNILLTVMPAL